MSKSIKTYDFHGLRVVQVSMKLVIILEEASRKKSLIRIITGKGDGALSSFVEDFLIKNHYPFKLEREGVFLVDLSSFSDFSF